MIVYARVALDAASIPTGVRDNSQFEQVTVEGVGESWAVARANLVIPENAVVLAVSSWPI